MTVRVSTLPNGLRVVTQEMPSVESVSLGLWVDVGTRHEAADENGVAHLLEHMAFKGTTRRTARDIAEEIEAVGGYLNAYTSREHTAYYAKVLKEHVPLAVDLIADILLNATFDSEELARERDVVIQEISQAFDTPDDIIFDYFQEAAFPDQALGRPVLGTPEVIGRLGREKVMEYMARHYAPERMVAVAAGRIAHEDFESMVGEAFAGLARADGRRADVARYRGGEFREARGLEQIHVVLGFEGIAYGDDDYYALMVLNAVLGGGMSSRLFQEVRERRGLAYAVFSFASSYVDDGLFGIYAGTGGRQVADLLPVICDELVRFGRTVDEPELARGRNQIKAGVLMSLESTSARCEQLAQQMLVYGRPVPVDEMVSRVEAVDSAALDRVIARLLATRPSFAAVGPLDHVEAYDGLARRLG